MSGAPHASFDLVSDLRTMLAYTFMEWALLASTVTAIAGGLLGWFMVLRRQTFAGHTLSVVAFPGASAALLAGVAVGWGYFGACVIGAVAIAAAGGARRRRSEETAIIAVVQAFALAAGFLFSSLYGGFQSGVTARLFGTILGITEDQVIELSIVTVGVVLVLAVIGRPLLLASVDPQVAAARGIPVRALDVAFLVLLGFAAAEASQITGSLLVFALLVMPAAAAQRLTARPGWGLALSVLIGLVVVWVGVAIAFYTDEPVGYVTTSLAFGIYVLTHLGLLVRGVSRLGPLMRARTA
jgi:zinc/manganese transport system permease protein